MTEDNNVYNFVMLVDLAAVSEITAQLAERAELLQAVAAGEPASAVILRQKRRKRVFP